jgi:hypothetical protein
VLLFWMLVVVLVAFSGEVDALLRPLAVSNIKPAKTNVMIRANTKVSFILMATPLRVC